MCNRMRADENSWMTLESKSFHSPLTEEENDTTLCHHVTKSHHSNTSTISQILELQLHSKIINTLHRSKSSRDIYKRKLKIENPTIFLFFI